jgi:hypothetical protein
VVTGTVIDVLRSVTPKYLLIKDCVMAARRIVPIGSPRSRPGRKKLRIASGPGTTKVMSLCDARRLRTVAKSGERLQGLNYPKDHLVGPDEFTLGFMPPEENMSWLMRMMKRESDPTEEYEED